MGPARAALERFHRLLIWLLPALLAFAGVGGYWVSRRALAPVDSMTTAVQAITVERLDRRIELPPADDELRRLASTFNDMLGRLQAAVSDIVRFTADASHELRTPVALLRTTAELSLRQDRTADEYRGALGEVLDYARQMSALVDDLLLLARSDAGIDAGAQSAVDVSEVAAEAGKEVQALADHRAVRLSVEIAPGALIVSGHRRSLQRLFRILLDNALTYTPPGGEAWLRVSAVAANDRGPEVLVEVADNGIGPDPVEMPRLFERFYRGARARAHAPGGSGLGLAIARTIVGLHRGSITITAVHPDDARRGCQVQVLLPLDRVIV
jgi:two-component system, OmpR family, heavy metal sensor histidine kinase CusS